jgi:proteasome accessory factor BC
MPSKPSKLQRHLDLIAYLVGRHLPVAIDDIMDGVPSYAEQWASGDATARATTRRMFERDKDELRRAGIPLQTIQYSSEYAQAQTEGYLITRRDFYLPYLNLVTDGSLPEASRATLRSPGGEIAIAEEDAAAALDALRRVAGVPSFPLAAEARSAFRKLAFDMAPDMLPPETVMFVDPPGAAELRERLGVLTEALIARKRVRFHYRGMYRDAASDRHVAGYGMLFQHGHWYFIGHDEDRKEIRVFRADRMSDVAANEGRPNSTDYEVPASFQLESYASRQAWELGGEEEEPLVARVLFRFPASLLAERNAQGDLVENRDDGAAVRAFRVSQVDPFVRWLLSMEGEAEILEPASLRTAFAQAAANVAAVHQGEQRDD